ARSCARLAKERARGLRSLVSADSRALRTILDLLWPRSAALAASCASRPVGSFTVSVRVARMLVIPVCQNGNTHGVQTQPDAPGHTGAMSFAVKNEPAAHPVDSRRPGDAILLNDPLLGSGHLPDFFITQPVFHEGEPIGFVVNILHHTDVGGQRPGSQGVEGIFDYFQEGLRIPPTKVWREYREDAGIVGIIAA